MFFGEFKKPINNKGFGIIEALVGITVGGLLLATFSDLIYQTIKINRANSNQIKATMYLQELVEVAKDLEQTDGGWQVLINVSSPSSPLPNGFNWDLTPGEETLEGNFVRSLTVEEVCRDSTSHAIKTCDFSDTHSTNTKKITAKITWDNGTNASQLETYVYKY